MIATVVNTLAILIGGGIGLFFGKKIKERYSETIYAALSLCVAVIGILSAVKTSNILHAIICLVLGSIIGEALRIEDRLEDLGGKLQKRFAKNDGDGEKSNRFAEGFLTTSLLYCVGSMAVMGSLEAGLNHDYSVIFSKSLIDGVSSITYAASLGAGVLFSGGTVFVYQGLITLLAGLFAPFLSEPIVTEMSVIGGIMLIGMALNMLEVTKKRIRLANMIPALFLPIAYLPFVEWISGFFVH